MQTQGHPLEPFFQQVVRNSYEGKLGLQRSGRDRLRGAAALRVLRSQRISTRCATTMGRPIEELEAMMLAADPVNGSAPSFDAERAMRKYIGDYALFVSGMYPEAMVPGHDGAVHHPSLSELIHAGKESYFIVSQFNLFEYEQEAPLFARLSDWFERCILGLTLVREELNKRKALPPVVN